MSHDLMALPELPVPEDDGAADHLPGMPVPSVALPATDGRTLTLDVPAGADRLVVYAYPRTGRPGEPSLTEDWDAIPGARGCTPESCGFRDHAAELRAVVTTRLSWPPLARRCWDCPRRTPGTNRRW